MSYLGGIGRGRGPVPKSPTAENRELKDAKTISSVIRSANWGRNQAGIGDSVSIIITLNKQAINANASVEILFNSGSAQHPFDNPISVPIKGLTAVGQWQTKAPKMKDWAKGYFTFRVKLDGQMMVSDALRLTDDPIARVVRRNNTDGFDG